MDKEDIYKSIDEAQERDIRNTIESMSRSIARKSLVVQAVRNGLIDPVLDYYSFTGSSMWPIYCNMPLNKPLFFQKVEQLKTLGWEVEGELYMGQSQVSQSFRYGKYPDSIQLHLCAMGEGVNCRLVVLQEGQPSKSAVVEWVCEEGAKEMEERNEIEQDEANPMYRGD